jgi:hypothetical protein
LIKLKCHNWNWPSSTPRLTCHVTSRDDKLCFNFSLRFCHLFYFILIFYLCIVNTVQIRANNARNISFIPFPRLGAHPRSFDPLLSRPRLRPRSRPGFWPSTATGARERAGQVSPRFPSPPPLRSHAGYANAGRQDDAGTGPPLVAPNLVHAHTGEHAGGFAPSPFLRHAPTCALTGTQTQDDAGRFGDKPPPFAPASSARRRGL